ncbi:hypothetical protein ACOWMU_04350 [Helicobacter pylori]
MEGVLLGANKKTLFSLSIKNAKNIFKTKRKELVLIKRQFLKKRYFLRGEMVQNNPRQFLKKRYFLRGEMVQNNSLYPFKKIMIKSKTMKPNNYPIF